ncbi:MAG: bifunctional [glutamine synthetase] adenylyltransferase/[glutamine synthetase]-adenylyl-L-tyrosine phosphorylase [Alphaproteobacteria bacterium]
MSDLVFPFNPQQLPRAGHPDWTETGIERLHEIAAGAPEEADFVATLSASPDGRRLLHAVFGNSPFLGHAFERETPFIRDLLCRGPDAVLAALIGRLEAEIGEDTGESHVMSVLRKIRQRVALLVGIADMAGMWSVTRVTQALSEFADSAIRLAVGHALRVAAARGGIVLADSTDPNRHSGFVVLGMGKLGARELNYSSDIDLIVLFDPEKVSAPDKAALTQIFVRVTRSIVKLLSERTADGYVFRTDLRLRPDPSSTPLAVSMDAALDYYESMGQNWERAAMIKARPVAGDVDTGHEFLDRLRPYIWRKHLDFAAIQDIHSIKRQITAQRGGGEIAVNGHNIKLGRGGIREIEFFTQTQQLIWGGREPELRTPETCRTLQGLVTIGQVTQDTADGMVRAYEYLRRVEHRLQMINDEQTQTLPKPDEDIEALAIFLGHRDGADFRETLVEHLRFVESNYAALFEDSPDLGAGGALVFTGGEDHPETVETLEKMGFNDGSRVSAIIRGWHRGRYRATRAERSRQLLTELVPMLLQALARTSEPDTALIRFDAYLRAQPAGVQLFSLFTANPPLLDLVAEILGNAPQLSDWLVRSPSCLDAVLGTDFVDEIPTTALLRADLERALEQANDIEDVLELTRRWAYEHKFQAGVQILRGVTDGRRAGPTLTAIADVSITLLWDAIEAEFIRLHGRVAGGGTALIAMGKFGGGELAHRSDIDMVMVYDHEPDAGGSDGPKPLVPGLYFTRLAQRLIAGITARTSEGRLYELDMRLRPSGNKGPIASRLDGFAQYQRADAWTWEQMALTRARVVTAPEQLRQSVEGIIRESLTRERDPEALANEVASMRTRMAQEHKGQSIWDIKHRRGGLVDIEFIAQYLMLRHASEYPDTLSPNTADALTRLVSAGLLDPATGADLQDTLALWQRLQGVLRLSVEGAFDGENVTEGQRSLLVTAGGATDFDLLIKNMELAATTVRGHFERLVGHAS